MYSTSLCTITLQCLKPFTFFQILENSNKLKLLRNEKDATVAAFETLRLQFANTSTIGLLGPSLSQMKRSDTTSL